MQKINIFADGAAEPTNPGPGGWAAILVAKNKGEIYKKSICGYFPAETQLGEVGLRMLKLGKTRKPIEKPDGTFWVATTNNRMEIYSILAALKMIRRPEDVEVEVFSDSQVAINCLSGTWRAKENLDMIQEGRELMTKFDKITFTWVKGHADNTAQNEVDTLTHYAIHNKIEREEKIETLL
jgi:ribonuclease HI